VTSQYKAARDENSVAVANSIDWKGLGAGAIRYKPMAINMWRLGADFGYAQAQAENSAVIAAKDAEIERAENKVHGWVEHLRAQATVTEKACAERDEWKQQAEKLRGALELADKTLKKVHGHAKECADIYDREWTAKHPGMYSGFCANMWRAAEQHILMCSSFFKTENQRLLAEYAAWKGEK
jgi:hypothetical protein